MYIRSKIIVTLFSIFCLFVINACDGTSGSGSASPPENNNGTDNLCVFNSDCQDTMSCVNGTCVDSEKIGIFFSCDNQTRDGETYERVDLNGIAGDGCECEKILGNMDQDDPDPLGIDENCDGIDGVLAASLFVDAENSANGTGTREDPYKNINLALADGSSTTNDILVAHGIYEENIVLQNHLRLFGGYSSDFLKRNTNTHQTFIRGQQPDFQSADPKHGVINAESITTETIVQGFHIQGYHVTDQSSGHGYNSYAIYILNSNSNLKIANNTIESGKGGNGAGGGQGSKGFGRDDGGGSVLDGGTGSDAGGCDTGLCGLVNVAGGSAGTNPVCTEANGISGGNVICPSYNTAAYAPDTLKDGLAGWNWTLDSNSSSTCDDHATEAGFPNDIKKMNGHDGLPGENGLDGSQGAGCIDTTGDFIDGHWVGIFGSRGMHGNPGERGGSGGSSGGIDSAPLNELPAGISPSTYNRYKTGATGGGSGAGGCGGDAGVGGFSGGASIGILITWLDAATATTTPTITANSIRRNLGGKGGPGGFGGMGGAGGDGGIGGDSASYWIDFKAGAGGKGGHGGIGGGGGGGCGGISFGIAVANYPDDWILSYTNENTYLLSDTQTTGGTGGTGGPSGVVLAGSDGLPGNSLNYFTDPDD